MTDASMPSASPHASHDTMLVAALAARAPDLSESDLARAHELTGTCADCADLLADILILQTALPTAPTPVRPRDFRLSPHDAVRLHRAGWRRVLGFFGSARDSVSRPLGVGLTTLGLAGLLVATLPSMFMGSGAGTALAPVGQAMGEPAASSAESYATDAASAAAASGAPEGGAPEGGAPEEGVFAGGESQQLEAQRDVAGEDDAAIRDDATGLSTLFVVAGTLLIAGLGLFGLRWSARRLL